MKKLILLSAISLSVLGGINAAKAQSGKPTIGIKAGASLTTLGTFEAGGSNYSYDYKPGFQGGVYADLPIANGFSFMPHVLYSQKGGNLKATVGNTTGEIKTRLNYLDVPLLFGYKPAADVTLFAGPQVAFLLSQSSESYANGTSLGTDNSTNNLRKSLIGGNVGVGYNVNSNVSINANYAFDFDKAATDNQNQPRVKNSGFGLSLGYSF